MARKQAPSRSREEWKRIISEQEGSGVSQAEYCRVLGIDPKLFSLKKKLFSKESKVGKFIELPSASSGGWEAEVEFPHGICIRVRGL